MLSADLDLEGDVSEVDATHLEVTGSLQEKEASKRYLYFSLFTGKQRYWSLLQRTLVTVDTVQKRLFCKCCHMKSSCIHKHAVRWHLFKDRSTLLSADLDLEGDVSEVGATHLEVTGSLQEEEASKRYLYFSLFTGKQRYWSLLQRTLVTVDTVHKRLICKCCHMKSSCIHKHAVRWHQLFEQMPPNCMFVNAG